MSDLEYPMKICKVLSSSGAPQLSYICPVRFFLNVLVGYLAHAYLLFQLLKCLLDGVQVKALVSKHDNLNWIPANMSSALYMCTLAVKYACTSAHI